MSASASGKPKRPPLPRELFGYDILDYLGEGAHSVIYAAASPVSKQLCALKYITMKGHKDDRWFQQFENEVDVGQWITHRGIRHPIELKANRDSHGEVIDAALVMEFFDGIPLGKRLHASTQTMTKIFIRTAEALGAMHSAGYIHCDLKPNNILVNYKREIRVIDLGQACRIGTKKERIQGTPGYMAPEQANNERLTTKTDIFNFGATLYSIMCQITIRTSGNGPYPRAAEKPVPPSQLNPDIPQDLSDLIMQCIEPERPKRPADMNEIIRRLEATREFAARHHKPRKRT
jgi:serine/threonine-protein kinase